MSSEKTSTMTERLSRPGVDLLLELAEHNAPRRCQRCDQQAEYYILTHDVLSEFVCEDDLDGAIERAQA